MQLAEERKRKINAENELKQMEASKRSREAEGVLVFEGELARREKALAAPSPSIANLDNADGSLRTGMTGFGRIHHDTRPLGLIVLDRAQRYLRREFWW